MTNWFMRLYMLLWKNFHLRWRTSSFGCSHKLMGRVPVFLLIEICWPIFLYLIMVILRANFPPVQYSDIEYRPIALPSAGTLPFIQGVLCDLGKGSQADSPDLPTYPNASINELYSVLDEFGSLNGTLDSFCSTIHSLTEQTTCINSSTKLTSPDCQKDVVPLTCFLGDPGEFESFLTSDLQFSPDVVAGIIGANVTTPQSLVLRGKRQIPTIPFSFLLPPALQGLLGGANSLASLSTAQLRSIACAGNNSLLEESVQFDNNITTAEVTDAVCGLNATQFNSLANQLQTQVFNTCDPLESVNGMSNLITFQEAQAVIQKYSDLTAGPLSDLTFGGEGNDSLGLNASRRFFCGETEAAERSSFQVLLERVLFGDTFQQGGFTAQGGNFSIPPEKVAIKILYSPQTNVTDSVIRKASRIFDTFEFIRDTAEEIVNCSEFFLQNYPAAGNQVEQTQQLLDILMTNNRSALEEYLSLSPSTVDQLIQGGSLDNATLEAVQRSLNVSAPGNLWEVVTSIRDVAAGVYNVLNRFDWNVFYPLNSEAELESLAANYTRQTELGFTTVFAGVVFEDLPNANTSLTDVTLKIRMNVTSVIDTTLLRQLVWSPGPESNIGNQRYIISTFVFIQDMVERALAEEISGKRISTPGLYLQQMPYPCHGVDNFVVAMEFILPVAMLFAWLFPVAMTVRGIVREKEVRLKEYIKMVGVSDLQLRLSRLIVSGSILLVAVCFITLFLKVGNILPLTDWSILFLYLVLYAVVMLGYSYLVSVFFNNANLAACVASLLYFMVLFAHVILLTKQRDLSPVTFGLCCLWAPLGFALGVQYMVQWEVQQVGLNWSNINILPVETDPVSFLAICVVLIIDTFLYFLVAWYIEGVAPGRYGVAKPFYFPFMPSYWLGQNGRGCCHEQHATGSLDRVDPTTISYGVENADSAAVCEDEPQHLTRGIVVDKLSKTYKNWLPWKCKKNVTAVKDLSLNFYEGQITALLGHNGAGKTTTLSVLAGLYEPTSGTASIYGNSIRSHMDLIRQGLGICPQHNILFDELTVEEHLLFFGRMKGLSWTTSKEQIPEWLSKVNLLPHATKLAKHLSGGMKRKLSILLAFVGGSRTIILDEPTAGVDPFARRQIWDFLLRQRVGRTIILSTHHMDEAEILADRIAIISNGSLICCGSFEFLKHRFGRGHQLALVTNARTNRKSSTASRTFTVQADVEETDHASSFGHTPIPSLSVEDGVESVTRFIQEFVGSCQLEEVRGRELRYLLPLHQARPSVLARLFKQLDIDKERLGITSYGLTACSMEEIFVQLTEKDMEDKEEDTTDASAPHSSVSDISLKSMPANINQAGDDVFVDKELQEDKLSCEDSLDPSPSGKRLSLLHLWATQFLALIIKRFHYTKHKLVALLVQNVLPLLLIFIALLIAYLVQNVPDPPRLELSPEHFFKVADYNYIFVGGTQQPETDKYIRTFFQPCGAGAHVTSDNVLECLEGNTYYTLGDSFSCPMTDYPQNQYTCTCANSTGELDCDSIDPVPFPYTEHVPQCFNGTGTGPRIQRVTVTYDPSQPELGHDTLTTYLLRSKNSFIQERYGGVSFGHARTDIDPSIDETNAAADASDIFPFLATQRAAKVWYSLKGYHAMPTYINLMNNGILRASFGEQMKFKYGIRTVNHPLPTTELTKRFDAITKQQSFLVNPMAAMFSLGFVVAGFVLILIEERSGNVKHLQLVCGMNKAVYWLANTTWDTIWYLGFMALMICLFLAFQDPFYTSPDVFPLFVLILLCYGFSVTPWVYSLSFLFNSSATAYVILFCLNFFGGFSILMIDAVLLYLATGMADTQFLSGLLNYWLLVFPVPAYALARPMLYLSSDYPLQVVASSLTFTTAPDPYEKLAPFLIAQVAQGVLYYCIVIVIETWPYIRRILCCRTSAKLQQPIDADSAVKNERAKVNKGGRTSDILTLENLSKIYRTNILGQKRVVVNQLSLSMPKAECFGLLGVNGAGKTTTFRMLTGDTRPSAGDAVITGNRLSQARGPVKQSIGYCPQVDALIDQLTGRQHLTLFCKLRGLRSSEVSTVVEWALLKLGLKEYADRPAGKYSGGNRRKLSTAISLLARPPLILLDEPTSGVDPRARHFLWTIIRGLVNAGQSVVLTTHSMAECEALCSRVGIMVNGEFCCLGSPQQLKSTYGEGYRLKVRVGGDVETVKEFIRQNFEEASLKEEHYTTLVYQLPTNERIKLHNVFEIIEQARETLDIQDYSVSQTTLDDVFIHFANEQSEEAGLASRQGDGTRPLVSNESPHKVDIELLEMKSSVPDLVADAV